MANETVLSHTIGQYLIGKTLKGHLKPKGPEIEYKVLDYSCYRGNEDVTLEVETPDGKSHRISLRRHLGDLVEDKEFDKGYEDATAGKESRPTSLRYVHGYEKGRELLEIRGRVRKDPPAQSSPKLTERVFRPVEGVPGLSTMIMPPLHPQGE